MRTRGSCETHEEKRRKKFVGQRLGVTPKSWLTPKRWLLIWIFVTFFFIFLHESHMSLLWAWSFSNVFHHFWMRRRWSKYSTYDVQTSAVQSLAANLLTGIAVENWFFYNFLMFRNIQQITHICGTIVGNNNSNKTKISMKIWKEQCLFPWSHPVVKPEVARPRSLHRFPEKTRSV